MQPRYKLLFFLFISIIDSCTTIPTIRLKSDEFAMQLNRSVYLIKSIAYSPKGNTIAAGDSNGTISLWDITSGIRLWSVNAHSNEWVWALAFTHDGKNIVSGGGDKMARIWDAETGKPLMTLTGFNNVITSLAVSRDDRYILAGGVEGSLDGILRLWDRESGRLIREFRGHNWIAFVGPAHVLSVDISPDSKYAISSDGQENTILWEIKTGKILNTYKWQGDRFIIRGTYKVAFLPDGKHFISTAIERIGVGVARLKETMTGKTVRTFEGDIIKIVLSGDGKQMLSGGPDGIIRLWDVGKGEMIKKFEGKGVFFRTVFSVDTMAFSPDGRYLISGSPDGSVRFWDIKSGREMALMASFDDGEWIMVTSDGYYHSSENGHKYLNVMMGLNTYTAEQFYDVFYRPDIVRAVLAGDDIKGFAAVTMMDAIKNPPPVVKINSLPDKSGDASVDLCYSVTDSGGGIGEIRIFHNGKLIESDGFYRDVPGSLTAQSNIKSLNSRSIYNDMRSMKVVSRDTKGSVITDSREKKGTFSSCCKIKPVRGENQVAVIAFNSANTVQGYMKSASFESTLPDKEPHLYIIAVGIDRYLDVSINLKYAVKDAMNMKDRLMRAGATIYKPENIHDIILINTNATKKNLLREIDLLAGRATPADSFIFFAAGHGVLLGSQYYMLTHDYSGALDSKAMMSSNEIIEFSKRIGSLNQLYIFDTCHAGGIDNLISGLYDARMSVLARKMGLFIFASASTLEEAMDGFKGNGLFTHALLMGIDNGSEADSNRDMKVTVTEIGHYAKNRTMENAKRLGHRQAPLIINFGRDSVLFRLK